MDTQDLHTQSHGHAKVISEAETGSDPQAEINMKTTEEVRPDESPAYK